jgi:hypothetical protein
MALPQQGSRLLPCCFFVSSDPLGVLLSRMFAAVKGGFGMAWHRENRRVWVSMRRCI